MDCLRKGSIIKHKPSVQFLPWEKAGVWAERFPEPPPDDWIEKFLCAHGEVAQGWLEKTPGDRP